MPQDEKASIGFQARSIGRRSRPRCGQAKGRMIAAPTTQRQKASAIGGTCPATARPRMALPAQNSAVSIISSQGRSNRPRRAGVLLKPGGLDEEGAVVVV